MTEVFKRILSGLCWFSFGTRWGRCTLDSCLNIALEFDYLKIIKDSLLYIIKNLIKLIFDIILLTMSLVYNTIILFNWFRKPLKINAIKYFMN